MCSHCKHMQISGWNTCNIYMKTLETVAYACNI
jgi:hypothetical protein